ncbi:multicopper oxidase domain-containing protein [Glutamicibacter arilaitensis]|uniref:multicopper oxidase domain-containing protein n=1 Tax=Glutamicibacter arilaitensis TaxID=256701 RepID=UPI003FD6807A
MREPIAINPAAQRIPGRGFWALRDLPTALWLIFAVVVSLIHRELPAPRWLLIHLMMLGALSHAILVWSQYFATALLKLVNTAQARRQQSYRLALMNCGALLVLIGVPSELWVLVAIGSSAIAAAALWHAGWMYRNIRKALPSPFGPSVRYYIAAACFLPIGAGLGTWIAVGLPSTLHERMTVAHAMVNLLGWVGLTVAGTLITLWPTMLRTRMAQNAATALRQALPVLVAGAFTAAAGAASGLLPLAALGLLAYLVGLGLLASPFIFAARSKPPRNFATLSVLAAACWWIGTLIWTLSAMFTSGSWEQMGKHFDAIAPYLVAGFGAQILVGALSYLIPVALGGGPRPLKLANAVFDRGAAWRIAMANVALLACALPVSSLVRVFCSVLYLIAMATFILLLFTALKTHRKAKAELAQAQQPGSGPRRAPEPVAERPAGQLAGQAAAGVMAVVLAVAVAVAIDPAAAGVREPVPASSEQNLAASNAPVQRVQVEAKDMAFTPNVIEVPAGTRLVIELRNTDPGQVHDLVLANGFDSGRLATGESASIDAGIISEDLQGWCYIVGHKQMGMTLQIKPTGAAKPKASDASPQGGYEQHHAGGDGQEAASAAGPDLNAVPGKDFSAFDARLDPLPKNGAKPVTHRETFTVSELQLDVAPGYSQKLWTFNGTAPGPTLHGKVGDKFEITLVNDGSMGHSIDFHAGALAPDEPMRTIAPGQSLTYEFTATKSGIWMYHCSTAPMSAHIANGMFGAVIIEPDDLPEVDQSFLLIQSEYYLGAPGGEVDMGKVEAQEEDLVVFNGYANQYTFEPLEVQSGDRVRFWVLDAGPNKASSFHVVGGQFDTVYAEGHYTLDARQDKGGGSQALALAPAQGGFVELELDEAGNYPFVTHYMSDAEKGAHGMISVK